MTRVARLIKHGEPLQIQDLDLPEPEPEEVLVELAFAGVNPVDRYVVQGSVAPESPLPRTLGSEASGRLDGELVLIASAVLGAQTGRDATRTP